MKSIASLTVSTKSVDYISTIWPTRRWTSAHNTCQPQPYPDHYSREIRGRHVSCLPIIMMNPRVTLTRHHRRYKRITSGNPWTQEWRDEQDLIVSITAHENAARNCHAVVLFGVSTHERTEIFVDQTDVFLDTGCISAKCARNASGTRTSHSIIPNRIPERTTVKICCDVIFHRAVVDEEMRHLDTFSRPHLVVCLDTDIPTARRPRRSDVGMQCLFGSRREVGSWVSR